MQKYDHNPAAAAAAELFLCFAFLLAGELEHQLPLFHHRIIGSL